MLAWLLSWFLPDPFTLFRAWRKRKVYAFKMRQAARLAATRHMALVAQAVWSGSTESYTLMPDLPRKEDSTQIHWDRRW